MATKRADKSATPVVNSVVRPLPLLACPLPLTPALLKTSPAPAPRQPVSTVSCLSSEPSASPAVDLRSLLVVDSVEGLEGSPLPGVGSSEALLAGVDLLEELLVWSGATR